MAARPLSSLPVTRREGAEIVLDASLPWLHFITRRPPFHAAPRAATRPRPPTTH